MAKKSILERDNQGQDLVMDKRWFYEKTGKH